MSDQEELRAIIGIKQELEVIQKNKHTLLNCKQLLIDEMIDLNQCSEGLRKCFNEICIRYKRWKASATNNTILLQDAKKAFESKYNIYVDIAISRYEKREECNE